MTGRVLPTKRLRENPALPGFEGDELATEWSLLVAQILDEKAHMSYGFFAIVVWKGFLVLVVPIIQTALAG